MKESSQDPSDEFDPKRFLSGDPDLDILNRFQSHVGEHDDRGLALSLAAFAEDTLGRLLLIYLREKKQARELVEGFNAPLGTLSARIKACYAMGLLKREQFEDLELCRKIRNAFAHEWEGITLDRQDIKAMIEQLNAYTIDPRPLAGGPRERLLGSVTTVLTELRVQIGMHRHARRRAPFVGFRLTIKPEASE